MNSQIVALIERGLKAKGPATAPTVPDHGPNSIPSKEKKMNSPETTTTLSGTPAPCGGEAMTSRFHRMTLEDLRNLFDGLQAAHHILNVNEWNCNGSSLTGSFLWFKAEAARINALIQEIADAALDRAPEDEDEAYEREQILVRAKPFRSGRRTYRTHTTVEVVA